MQPKKILIQKIILNIFYKKEKTLRLCDEIQKNCEKSQNMTSRL